MMLQTIQRNISFIEITILKYHVRIGFPRDPIINYLGLSLQVKDLLVARD